MPPSPDTPNGLRLRTASVIGVLLLAWLFAAAPGLLVSPIERASKARAVGVARNMVRSGDWIVPVYNGEPRLKKPPLHSWMQASAMVVTGSTAPEIAGLASWLMGLLFVLAPWLIGSALGRPVAGLFGSLCLASTRGSGWWGGSPEHDVSFAAWTGLSWALLALHMTRRPGSRFALASGLACGAAVLVKGPFALAFLWGTALGVSWIARRRQSREAPPAGPVGVRWLPFLVGSLAPGLAWVVAVAVRLGSVGEMFSEVGNQATGGSGSHVYRGALYVFYYLGELPKWTLPWSVPGILAILWLSRSSRRRLDGARDPARPSLLFAAVALAVSLAVLTATPGKQPHYVLPLMPLACLLFGGAFERLLAMGRAARASPWIAAGLGAAVAIGRWQSAHIGVRGYADGLLLVIVGMALILVPAIVWARRGATLRGVAWGLIVAACGAGVGGFADAARSLRTEDYRAAVAAMPRPLRRDVPLVGFAPPDREAFDALAARLDRDVLRVTAAASIDARLEAGGPFYLLLEAPQAALVATQIARMRRVAVLEPESPRDPDDRILVFEAAGGEPAAK